MAISLVNAGSAFNSGSASQIISGTFAEIAGNLLVVFFRYNIGTSSGTEITGVSDTAGNTFIKIIGTGVPVNTYGEEMWYAKNILAVFSGTIIGSLSSGTITNSGLAFIQYSGVDTSSPLDQFIGTAVGTNGGTLRSGTVITTKSNEVVIVGDTWSSNLSSGTITGSAGYTIEVLSGSANPPQTMGIMDLYVSTTGTQFGTMVNNFITSSSYTGVSILATFKASSQPSSGPWNTGMPIGILNTITYPGTPAGTAVGMTPTKTLLGVGI